MIVRHICAHVQSLPPSVLAQSLPVIPASLQLDDLELESRTRNCLQQMMSNAGLARLEDLGSLTVGQILPTSGFGAKGLVDLLTSLEGVTLYSPPPFLADAGEADRDSREFGWALLLMKELERLRTTPRANSIRLDDPRLGRYLRAIFRYAASLPEERQLSPQDTVLDLASRLAMHRSDPPNAAVLCGQIHALRKQIGLLSRLTLEKELRSTVLTIKKQRVATIVLRYRGWEGSGPCTLKEAGEYFGITASAVKKKWADFRESLGNKEPHLPIIEKSLAVIESQSPAPADEIESVLRGHGLTGGDFRLEGLFDATELFKGKSPFRIEIAAGTRIVVPEEAAGITTAVLQIGTQLSTRWGIVKLAEVVRRVRRRTSVTVSEEFVFRVLQLRRDCRWLGPRGKWFALMENRNNPLARLIGKVLSVSRRLDVEAVRAVASKKLRPFGAAFPRVVLSAFCRELPGCRLEGNMLSAIEPIEPQATLCNSEFRMFRVLKEKGPLLYRSVYRGFCLDAGISANTFCRTLKNSSVIVPYAASHYGIVGLPFAP